MNSIKLSATEHNVLDVYKNRWSARAFTEINIAESVLNSIFEAARWAASANNEQPWQFIYARKGTAAFDKIWSCLMPGNQPWAKNANVLIVTIARTKFAANGNNNRFAHHDLGMATSALLHQAIAFDVYTHPMAGYKKEDLIAALQLAPDQDPACIIAAGYLGEPDTLEEPFKTRELTPRSRKTISEFVTAL